MAGNTSEFRLDRTAFKATNAVDADNHLSYWRNRTIKERLEAANFLINQAYGVTTSTRLDKTAFCQRKQS